VEWIPEERLGFGHRFRRLSEHQPQVGNAQVQLPELAPGGVARAPFEETDQFRRVPAALIQSLERQVDARVVGTELKQRLEVRNRPIHIVGQVFGRDGCLSQNIGASRVIESHVCGPIVQVEQLTPSRLSR